MRMRWIYIVKSLFIWLTILGSTAHARVILIGSNHGDIQAEYKFKRALCTLANQNKIIFATEAVSIDDESGILKTDFGCQRNASGIEDSVALATMSAIAAITHVRVDYSSDRTMGYIDQFFTQMRSVADLSRAVDEAMRNPKYSLIASTIRGNRPTVNSEHIHYLVLSNKLQPQDFAEFIAIAAQQLARQLNSAGLSEVIARLTRERVNRALIEESLSMMARVRGQGMVRNINSINRQENRPQKKDVVVVLGRNHINYIVQQIPFTEQFTTRDLARPFLTKQYGFKE